MQKITPFLWFDTQAQQAAALYVSLFPNSKITSTTHYGASGPGPQGSVMTVSFELDGQKFTALNGGPVFHFTEAVSFSVACESQAEVDKFWNALTANGGTEGQCGWLKDTFGLSWQITPTALKTFLSDSDPTKVQRVMQAMLQMKKIDIDVLTKAYEGNE